MRRGDLGVILVHDFERNRGVPRRGLDIDDPARGRLLVSADHGRALIGGLEFLVSTDPLIARDIAIIDILDRVGRGDRPLGGIQRSPPPPSARPHSWPPNR